MTGHLTTAVVGFALAVLVITALAYTYSIGQINGRAEGKIAGARIPAGMELRARERQRVLLQTARRVDAAVRQCRR